MHGPHFEQQIAIVPILAILALVVGGFMLCVLFFFKRTQPLAWTLLGLGILGLMFMGYAWLSVRHVDHVRMAPMAVQQEWSHFHEDHPVDIDEVEALWGSRIRLDGETVVMRESAHVAHPVAPLEINEAVEAAPPEPQEIEDAEPVSDDYNTAASSASTSSSAPERTGESSPPPAASRSSAGENRPDWVDNKPARDPQTYPVVINTDPFDSRQEADRQLSELITIATTEVVSDLVGNYPSPEIYERDHGQRYRAALEQLRGMGLTPGMVRSEVLQDDWVESLEHLDLPYPMLRIHALLEFDQPFQVELQDRWREQQAHQRLGILGMIAAGVVGLLAVVWGTLRFDTATKGYYTKWLIGGAVLGTMAVGLLVLVAVA